MTDSDSTVLDQRTRLDQTRSDLNAKLASLQAELQSVEEGDADVSFDEEGGEGSGVSVERDRLAALLSAVSSQLHDTEVSLARVANGTYGICEACHKPIPAARLEAMPNARMCVSCKAGGISTRR
jgi:DnaK suppressor protein